MSTGTAPTTAPPGESLSQVERVVNTFVAPSKTFQDIRRSASWWVPWLLVSLFSIAFLVVIDKKIGWDQIMQTEVSRSARASAQMEQLTPEQRARALQMQAKIYKYAGYAAPVFTLIYIVVIAGVLMATFNFGAGAEVKFSTAMAVVSYSWLPGIISAAVGIISLLAGVNPEGFSIRNPVASNVASWFMDPNGNKFLYGMLSALDLFTIWMLILMGMGFATNSKVKKGTSYAIVIGWYLLYKLVASAAGTLG